MKINILIVDDLKTNLLTLKLFLESIDEEYVVIEANSGLEALDIVSKRHIDLIILDIEMPGIDGFEVAEILKSKKETEIIPIIFFTAAFTSDEYIEKGLSLGVFDYVTKPIDKNQFLSKILLYTRLVKSISDNRQKDQQLQKQFRLVQMGEMLSMISHQWRQPLAAISMISARLSINIELDEYKKESFEKGLVGIRDLVQNLSRTIDDFKNFYKPNKKSLTRKLDEVIEEQFKISKESLLNDNIKIIEEYNSQDEIEMYDNEMMHVILNIFKNAQDNFKEKNTKDPCIKVKTQKRKITIYDNGGGISEDIIDKIFDPYFSTKDEKQGVGLGLYMAKTIVEEHHEGKIYAFNVDDGVCFSIELGIIKK